MNVSSISSRSALGKALRFPLRFVPAGARMPILQGPLRGKRWICGAGTHGCWLGTYEIDKQVEVRRAIGAGNVVYDLGANTGIYTLLASGAVGAAGHVYSFEPLPRNIRYLREHIAMNGCGNCTVVEAAVSDRAGRACFEVAENAYMGRLGGGGAEQIEVNVVVLDELVAAGTVRPPDVIKCDVEGAEAGVLRGAREVLRRYRPKVFLATHGAAVHAECCALLREAGYALRALDGAAVEASRELAGVAG